MPYCPECAASLPAAATSCPTCGAALLDTPTLVAADAATRQALDPERLKQELAAALTPRYELLRPLGEGGMGLVFLAREPALKRLVAVKLLAPDLAGDPAARARFEREARAAAALSHPNVVRVYAVGETAKLGLPYIVMQFVEGATLAEVMERQGRVGEREARRIIGEVAAALAAAHGRDLVHRDVKPSNVLIEKDTGRAYVADFGVSAALSPAARAEQTKLTATGMMIGTPVYMSPEQASAGEVGPASDIYSLGVLGYELLTGRPPFTATTPMGWVAAHLRDTPTPVAQKRTDVAPEVALLVDRCLAKDPAARPSAADVERGMLPSLETEVPWPPPGLHDLFGQAKTLSRRAVIAFLAGGALLLLLAFPPRRLFARGRWLDRFHALLPEEGPFVEADRLVLQLLDATLFGWQAGLVLATLVFVVALVGLLAALQRQLGAALRSRVAGWRWTTLADVTADTDGRGGLLLAGAREFAPLSSATRAAVLASRRYAVLLRVLAALWVATVLVVRVLSAAWLGASGGSVGPLIGLWTVTAALVPAIAGMLAAAAAKWRERSLLGALARRRAFVPDPSEVAAWYALATPGVPSAPASARSARIRRAALGVAALASALAVLAACTLGAAAAVIASRNTRWIGPQTAELLRAVDRFRRDDPDGQAATLLRSYAPPLQQVSDSEARALYRSLTGRSGLPDYPDHARWQRMIRAQFPAAGGAGTGDLFRRAYDGRLGRDTLQAMAAIAVHPRTLGLRRLARVADLDIVEASSDRPLSELPSVDALLDPGWGDFQFAAEANVLAALGDVARRDLSAAAQRLGENARLALLFKNTPTNWASWTAGNVQRFAFRPLAEIERLRGNQARADSLLILDRERRGLPVASQGLAADVADVTRLGAIVSDGIIPASVRFELLSAAWYGFCLNPREIAFGPSRARRDTLAALAVHLRAGAGGAAFAALLARGWERSYVAAPIRGLPLRARWCGIYFRWL